MASADMKGFTITREIGIDMGHRVPTHGSKCANFHGHRYTIQATCTSAELHKGGEQQDMVLDFGFLKGIMMDYIDHYHDHGTTLWIEDEHLESFYDEFAPVARIALAKQSFVFQEGKRILGSNRVVTKLMIVKFIPTAEKLAEFWFQRMAEPVREASKGLARLYKVVVWETPNCSAQYPSEI